MARAHKPPLAEVAWVDAQDINEQCKLDDVADIGLLAHRVTCGYLVFRDEERIVLAHDYDPPNACGNLTVIPAGWVKSVREIGRRRAHRSDTSSDTTPSIPGT